jgi:hypothetical protein
MRSELDSFNFLDFFQLGGFQFNCKYSKLTELEHFAKNNEEYDLEYNGSIPVKTAKWDTDFDQKENPPVIYKDILAYLLSSNLLRSYQNIYGNFSFIKLMMHETPKSYINTFHSHTYDGTHLHILVHLSAKNRTQKDGGLIELAEVVDKENVIFNPKDFYYSNPKYHKITLSSVVHTGLCTIINNINPYFRHQVTEVFSDLPRFTFMVALGYSSQVQSINRKIDHI